MAGGFHLYYEAARALWDMPSKHLESLAKEGEPLARRRAAATALGLKAEFLTPQGYTNEHSAVTKLAAALSDDREFTMDMALRMGASTGRTQSRVLVQSGIGHHTRRSTLMWIAITAAVVLLLLDVMATAGLPVPTPIGDLIDRFSGSDESPVTPPPPPPGSRGLLRDPALDMEPVAVEAHETRHTTSPDGVGLPAVQDDSVGNLERANGKELHQAQGRELHQARGRGVYRGRGRGPRQAATGERTGHRRPPHTGSQKAKRAKKEPRAGSGRAKGSHE